MTHRSVDDDQITIQVRFTLKGNLKAFRDGSLGVHDACTCGEEL
jgi:hypothetical protein